MAAEDQREPLHVGREPWALWALRSVQTADLSHRRAADGAILRMAILPEFPGPCLLFRASCITEDVLSHVFRACSSGERIISGNLGLVLDRVLASLLILRSSRPDMGNFCLRVNTRDEFITPGAHQMFAAVASGLPPGACYSACEESLQELILLRRRELNGYTAVNL